MKGFGLLEMLLVIALMGVMATVGISSYRMRAVQQEVQHAAEQMQQILQSAMAYDVDHGGWPSDLDAADFQPYLPTGLSDALNPWGEPYALTHPSSHRVGVVTVLPSQVLAKRLGAALGHATVRSDDRGFAVTAEVAVPAGVGVAAQPLGWQIIRVGQVAHAIDGQWVHVEALACEGGNMQVIPNITGIHPKIERLTGGDPIAHLAITSHCRTDTCSMHVKTQEAIRFGQPMANGSVDFQYMVLCKRTVAPLD